MSRPRTAGGVADMEEVYEVRRPAPHPSSRAANRKPRHVRLFEQRTDDVVELGAGAGELFFGESTLRLRLLQLVLQPLPLALGTQVVAFERRLFLHEARLAG